MSTNIVPPAQTVWAEYNPNTMRFTGQWQLLSPGRSPADPTTWTQLDMMDAVPLLNGTRDWRRMARVANRVIDIDPAVDLRFLSHISPQAWPEIRLVDAKWSRVPYVPLAIPKIEPDDWNLFWDLWKAKNADITRGLNETQYWKGLCCWLNPEIDHTKFNYSNTVVDDWSAHFPQMFQALRDCLPWYSMEKVVLWSNINEVNPHIDPDVVIYPWPDSLRVMIWDTNDGPTFWMSKWPERGEAFNPPIINVRTKGSYGIKADRIPQDQRTYVKLPADTNTFVFNNGAFLHGADLAKPKIIMAIKGRPKVFEWLQALEASYTKYQNEIPLL
jgi:hypothetical protein